MSWSKLSTIPKPPIRPSAPDFSANCPISEALRPDKFKDHWEKIPDSDHPDAVHRHQANIFKRYHFIRRVQSSANSKFAHLVRADIVPSFFWYRKQNKDVHGDFRLSMLNNDSTGPLSGYARYVDYTIGRSFVVTNSGWMGLAPSGSRERDIIVQLQTDGRVIWLTLREEEFRECGGIEVITSSNEAKVPLEKDGRQPSY